jgi:hypothetical protein
MSGDVLFDETPRPRVLVLTDITNEPDDEQSLVRFLCYANEFDIEGLVATTSCWLRGRVAPGHITERVDAYGAVRDNLLAHAPAYPTADYLHLLTMTGVSRYGMEGVGEGMDSDGSRRIIDAVDDPDPRPVWVCVWGGVNCLAQALWSVREARSPVEVAQFVAKLRVYTISDQDDSAPWIRREFPTLFYIVSLGYEERGGGAYHHATWVGISGDKFHGRFSGPDFALVDNPWLDEHIRVDHGPLGGLHPRTKYLMEGDTPTFLHLIPNGLGQPDRPDYGGWGGRYVLDVPREEEWHYEQETRPIWTDTEDEVVGVDGVTYTSNQATIWRWREAYQHDFAARIDHTVAPTYDDANHNPVAVLFGDTRKSVARLTVTAGETVSLNAEGTHDPDGDNVAVRWFIYPEPGTYDGAPEIRNADTLVAELTAPTVGKPETLHVILEARDDGDPALFAYRRLVLRVDPAEAQ